MLEERSSEQEIMDDLAISGPVIDQTLKELNTINKTLGGNHISISAFKKLAKNHHLSLADLGCGGGDIMVEMAKWGRETKIKTTFVGVDANPNIVSYAEKNTKNYPEISYRSINIFSEEFKKMKFDIIHCCLFLHHFTNEELIDLFRTFKKQVRVGVIINDLHRHPVAYWSIKALTYLFSRSKMVRNDAAISVARGFKRKELIHILDKAGIEQFDLSWKWAFRWKIIFGQKMNAKIVIRRVELNELTKLKDLAKNTFVESFGSQNTEEDMKAYVQNSFSEGQVEKELTNPSSRFFFAIKEDEKIGYLKINTGDAQSEDFFGNALEIERIYVKPLYQKRKVGQLMFDYAIEIAKQESYQVVWLGVWDQNEKAIKFYTKNGFEIFGSHPFLLGKDQQTDILMKIELS